MTADDRDQTASLDLAEGRAALEKGDLERAAAKLRRAIQLRPDSSEAQSALGAVLEKQGDVPGASAAYQKAVELNPADPSARGPGEAGEAPTPAPTTILRGWRSSRATSARAASRRSSRCSPTTCEERPRSSWGWYALGYSLFAQQKIGEAIQALAKSLQLDIKNAEAHKILGRTLMIIGRFDAAQLEFEQGIRLQAGLRGDPLQPRQALLDPGQLGAGAEGARGRGPSRPLLRRGAGRPRVRARGARRRRGRAREVRAGDRAQPGSGRAASPPPT